MTLATVMPILASLAGCATHEGPVLRTGWIKEILRGETVAQMDANKRDSLTCAAGKSREEIESSTWAVVSISHLRSFRYRTLPLDAQYIPAVGARVLVDVPGCRVLPAR